MEWFGVIARLVVESGAWSIREGIETERVKGAGIGKEEVLITWITVKICGSGNMIVEVQNASTETSGKFLRN